jgi:hypothetical protein
MFGISSNGLPPFAGVIGVNLQNGNGVLGQSSGIGVLGRSLGGDAGVVGDSPSPEGVGVRGRGRRIGVEGIATGGADEAFSVGVLGFGSGNASAGHFSGRVRVTGFLFKSGGGFEIDHPLDPGNKYLRHSFVESAEMLNVYSGNVTTDARGEATVVLPDYCEALNQDLRYQLTVIGQFAQAIVVQEVHNNQFTIATDQPEIKVSWQVTGVRQDPWAVANRIAVDEEKSAEERGRYLHPEVWGQPAQLGIHAMLQPSEQPPPVEPPPVERLEELPRMTDPARLEEEWRQAEELVQQMRQSISWPQWEETSE